MHEPNQRDDEIWFPRFGDIPGLSWNSEGIDRTSLPGHDARPQASSWDSESSWWPQIGGEEDAITSATPAQQYRQGDFGEAKGVGDVLSQLAEALELPGNPSDYHFLIAAAQERLWKFRFEEPNALAEIERLCLLDIELVRARPEIIAPYSEGEPALHMAVFDSLFRLYLREGYLEEAEALAEQAVSGFGQTRNARRLEEVRERKAMLEAENA